MLELLPNERQTILIKALRFEFNLLILSVSLRIDHPEAGFSTGAPSTLLLLIKFSDVRFVDGSVFETSLIGALINNHGVFHVITCVRNDSYNSIGATWVLSEVILLIFVGVDQGLLGEEDTVHFVIHTIGVVVIGRSHSLLGHLTLIHVTRGLIVLWEGLHGSYNTQNVHRIQLLMSGVSPDILFLTSNREIKLL